MGQRLNIEIIKNNKTIANCYYHWSAYTFSSLVKASEVIENYDNLVKQNLPDEVLAVKMFENCESFSLFGICSAGLTEDSLEYMNNKYPNYTFKEGIDRNAGLIGVTLDDIINTRKWEEGRVTIDLDKEIINAGWMLDYIETEEYLNECEEYEEEVDINKIPVFPYNDLDEISFDKLKEVINKIASYEKKGIYVFKSKDNSEIIRLIA